jgi:hypothetical protein
VIQVSFGAGRNSGAMLLGMYERGIRPDVIVFADTGNEKPETYAHMWQYMQPWLAAHGMPAITIVIKGGLRETLEERCLRTGYMPSIAYGLRGCSHKFKIEPTLKFLNNWLPAQEIWAKGERIEKAIGYHYFEPQRAKPLPEDEAKKYVPIYPLIEWRWGPDECEETFGRHGLPVPPKSACFFCPSSKANEVLQLHRNHPDLFARALAIEAAAASNTKSAALKGLGRDWSWDDVVRADAAQLKLFPETVTVPCMCFDGEDDE